jgi:hypothetical protein
MGGGGRRMLKKIISIKNVGQFHNSAAPGNPQLAKYTFIAGANGYGKTTICAVLRVHCRPAILPMFSAARHLTQPMIPQSNCCWRAVMERDQAGNCLLR